MDPEASYYGFKDESEEENAPKPRQRKRRRPRLQNRESIIDAAREAAEADTT